MRLLYSVSPSSMDDSMRNYTGHGGKWARWCVWDIFKEKGYSLMVHDWLKRLSDCEPFDVVLAMQYLYNVQSAIGPETMVMLRTTTAYADYHNQMAMDRVDEINHRRGALLNYKRLQKPGELTAEAIEQADYIVGVGNEFIKNTFPERVRDKINMTDNVRAYIGKVDIRESIPEQRGWLWHFGSGAIHKGLDLCLEAFAKHPEWELHVTANLSYEPDILKEFAYEFQLPNIHYYGWLSSSSAKFRSIVDKCVGFLGPTCSEGQSPAVATCLSLGLYPVISRQSGIDLPNINGITHCGIYLQDLTIEDVENKVALIMDLPDYSILNEIRIIQQDALWRYSQERFRDVMTEHIERALNAKS